GSYLHQLAYPSGVRKHVSLNRELKESFHHNGQDIRSLQMRGEYLYTANGPGGLEIFDIARVNNKGFGQRIVNAPVSPAGQRLYVRSKFATAVAAPSTLAVDPVRSQRIENDEQRIAPL